MSVYDTKEYKDSIKRRVSYEWWVEHTDPETEDIEDCYHIDLAQWFKDENEPREGWTVALVLKRYAGSEAEGVDDIGHAYIVNGELEKEFCSTHKVPSRYSEQYRKSAA